MFISKYGKTYDDADGSEQSFDGPGPTARAGAQRGGQIGSERWDDDGGPVHDVPAAAPAVRPRWSVLSARDLNEAIRLERRADDPSRLQQEAERSRRVADRAASAAAHAAADARRAWDDRYRNAWENT